MSWPRTAAIVGPVGSWIQAASGSETINPGTSLGAWRFRRPNNDGFWFIGLSPWTKVKCSPHQGVIPFRQQFAAEWNGKEMILIKTAIVTLRGATGRAAP